MDESLLCANAVDHCCWFGTPCIHLEQDTLPGRHWVCGLRRRYASWDAVYESLEWPAVLERAVAAGLTESYRCDKWPPPGLRCESCGAVGK